MNNLQCIPLPLRPLQNAHIPLSRNKRVKEMADSRLEDYECYEEMSVALLCQVENSIFVHFARDFIDGPNTIQDDNRRSLSLLFADEELRATSIRGPLVYMYESLKDLARK